jgi:hypothetical protein
MSLACTAPSLQPRYRTFTATTSRPALCPASVLCHSQYPPLAVLSLAASAGSLPPPGRRYRATGSPVPIPAPRRAHHWHSTVRAGDLLHRLTPFSAHTPIRRLQRGLPEQTHCAAQRALDEIRSPASGSRRPAMTAVIELEQGRISRSWQPDATTSRWRPRPDPSAPHVPASPARMEEETGMHFRYLWARHPEIPSGNVHHRQRSCHGEHDEYPAAAGPERRRSLPKKPAADVSHAAAPRTYG